MLFIVMLADMASRRPA